MADTFNNDLRVREQEAGSNSGTWGGLLNTTISNLASAFGQGSEAIPNASTHTITLADGAADEARSMYLKCTGGGQACTVTLAPNTISKVWIISNETSFTLTFSQGSGANVAVAAGAVKMIVTDGAGATGAVTDALSGLEGDFGTVTADGLTVDTSDQVIINHSADGGGIRIDSTNATNTGSLRFGDVADNYIGAVEYNHTNDSMSFYANNATRMTISSSGNVAIGTTSLTTLGTFVVQQSADSKGIALIDSAAANTFFIENQGDEVKFRLNATNPFTFTHNTTERMRIGPSGRVSINTVSATELLNIAHTSGNGAGVEFAGNGNTIGSTSAFYGQGSGNDAYVWNRANSTVLFGTNNAERARIDSSGNLLVGKTVLEYSSNAGIILRNDGLLSAVRDGGNVCNFTRLSSDGEIIQLNKGSTNVGTIGTVSSGLYIASPVSSDSGLRFSGSTVHPCDTAGAPRDAAVDLGYASGRFKDLFLSGQAIAGDGSVTAPSFRGTDTNTGIFFPSAGVTAISRNGVEGCRMDASGHLLVGKTSATAQGLGTEIRGPQIIIGKTASGTVNGIYFNHTTSYVGGLNYSNTATALVTSSDERLKENIADADDAGSKIDAMQVRKFDWKEDGSHQEYGFVAQELEPVFNHAVHTAEDDMGTKSVDYASLVPMLVKEIQSLRNRVAELENN